MPSFAGLQSRLLFPFIAEAERHFAEAVPAPLLEDEEEASVVVACFASADSSLSEPDMKYTVLFSSKTKKNESMKQAYEIWSFIKT